MIEGISLSPISDIEGSVCRQKYTLKDLTTGNFATFRQSSSSIAVADQRKAWIMYIGTGPSIPGEL